MDGLAEKGIILLVVSRSLGSKVEVSSAPCCCWLRNVVDIPIVADITAKVSVLLLLILLLLLALLLL